ncbi:hypothetical protein [Haloferax sp. Atlit-6N]|uniref:hypothetical protein n=1 Tax=Haloferax sp. Atlit-6N TaxID=2077205 RepID=UPI0011C043BA|nr:hypothetical protein [Haloferax sp. Atlit-6N]
MKLSPTHWLYVAAHAVIFLIGVVIISFGGTIAISIGTSLIAAGAAGWILFLYVWISEDRTKTVRMLTNFGLTDAFDERGPKIKDTYAKKLDDVNESIDILGFGLKTFREDFGDEFENWATTVDVRVLLIDPTYPMGVNHTYAQQRDEEEGNRPDKIYNDVKNFVDETQELRENEQYNFDIRLYQCLPSVTIFRIDDEMFWGPYTVRNKSRNMPIFLVEDHGHLFENLQDHFDAIWESEDLSRSVPETFSRDEATVDKPHSQ